MGEVFYFSIWEFPCSVSRGTHCLRIWVMKDYADASSWTKIISLAAEGFIEGIPRSHCRHKAIGFRKSGEVILEMYGGYLVSHDLETQEIKDLRIRGCGLGYTFVDSYVESLVLLDKPNQGKDRKERGTTRGKINFIDKLIFMVFHFVLHIYLALIMSSI